ncbi:HNH endonuclease [Rhodobacter sphaeroides]|uniref:HNH endonuclease n=1 Tax=Cereibacter sphaeroides TaxID=1063 RepID=UPI0013219B89|nr:HNH endonuclease signature motif containing protein [Cereibacter sphaeroides]MWP40349.1 HNH endonuclease [Cereibacter sphaeroides]
MIRKLCCAPGCEELAPAGQAHCPDHAAEAEARARSRKARAKAGAAAQAGAAFYATGRWRRARARFLAAHPLCADCAGLGLVVAAAEVDHIRPHRGDPGLMWDRANWQPLCRPCHSRKTAREVFHPPGGIGKSEGSAR